MSFTVRINIPKGLQDAPQRVGIGLLRGVERATGYVTNRAIENAPRRTSTLKRSIQASEVSSMGGRLLGKVVQDQKVAKYGPFVEFGTGLYGPKNEPIRPVNAKVLAWKGPGGKMMFRRSVKGMKPRPYMRPALQESLSEIERLMQDSIDTAVKG